MEALGELAFPGGVWREKVWHGRVEGFEGERSGEDHAECGSFEEIATFHR
jgi:hypothetical protein